MSQFTSIAGFRAQVPVSLPTVYRLIAAGQLKAIKVGRRTFIINVEEYLTSRPSLTEAKSPMPRGRRAQS